jgi:ubiquinone/menaquinone biosynthesis C-methylase UbiE
VADLHFEHPRLVAVYDALDPDRGDLDAYLDLVGELDARRVLDLGCGTGVLALLVAARGLQVTGVDPAAGSLAVARSKPGASQVRWLHGDASVLPAQRPPLQVDLVTMTGNAAQAIVDPSEWAATLRATRQVLAPGGHLALETRDPARRAWQEWTRQATERTTDIDGVGAVRTWVEVTEVDGPLVTFDSHFVFAADGAVLVSSSTLRFRDREDVAADLTSAGFTVQDVRDAPDRPGMEFVFLAQRPGGT